MRLAILLETPLSSQDVILFLAVQFLVYFPAGFLLLGKRLNSFPFVIRLPIILSLGMVIVDIAVSIIGLLYVGNLTFLSIGLLSYGLLLIRLFRGGKFRKQNLPNILLLSKSNWPSVISFLVITAVVIHFALAAGYAVWPPIGDIFHHGLLTSILVDNGAFQLTLTPINPDEPWFEPVGLHMLAANLALTFQVFPAIAVFIVGTTVITLILLVVYSIVYLLTRSVVFSILALMTTFYVSSTNSLEYYLIGYYYNGPYANLFGYLALFVYFAVEFIVPAVDHKSRNKSDFVLPLVSMAGVLLTYTPLLVLPLIHLVSTRILLRWKRAKKIFRSWPILGQNDGGHRSRNLLMLVLGVFALAAVVIFSSVYFHSEAQPLIDRISSAIPTLTEVFNRVQTLSYHYSLPLHNFIGDINGPITILTTILAVIALTKRQFVYLSSFYLLVSVTLILSTLNWTSEYLWFVLPIRMFIFLSVLNWIMILTYSKLFITWLTDKKGSKITLNRKVINPKILMYIQYGIIVIPLAFLFLPSVISNITLREADANVAWFSRSESFRDDYEILVWISKNIDGRDLIMVDNSIASLFIDSFELKNLTTSVVMRQNIQASFENQIAWERPELLEQFVKRYDVKYVVLLSSPVHISLYNLGGDGGFHVNKYTASDYRNLFDDMPFLEQVKRIGTASVYKVNNNK